MSMSNMDRVEVACRFIAMMDEPEQREQSLADGLANLMHFAHHHDDVDWDTALARATAYFAAEVEEEEEGRTFFGTTTMQPREG